MKTLYLCLTLLFVTHASGALQSRNAGSSGSQSDIQAAIDGAPAGGTVVIPNGTWTWSGTLTINKAIHLKGESRSGTKIVSNNAAHDIISVTEPASGDVQISDLHVEYSKADNTWRFFMGVHASNPRGSGRLIVHDCDFIQLNYAYTIEWSTNGGVIYNCLFDGSRAGGLSGISFVVGLPEDWTRVSSLGTADTDGRTNTYVEDCTFKATPIGCMNWDDNSRVVVRHCVFQDAQIGSHGLETSVAGARQWELYDCDFKLDPNNALNLNCYLHIRGGTGVVCDTHFDDIIWGKSEILLNVFNIRRRPTSIPCQTHYPAARQIGQGWCGPGGFGYASVPELGTGYCLDPMYFWGNTGTCQITLNEYQPDECGNGQQIADYVQLDRDYFVGVAKPGYQKYPYPHWMRTESGGGGNPTPTPAPTPTPPKPTPTPSATPAPTSTPTPVPTPTPGPTPESYSHWLDDLARWILGHPPRPNN